MISIHLQDDVNRTTTIFVEEGGEDIGFICDGFDETEEGQIKLWRAAIKIGMAMGATRSDFVAIPQAESTLNEFFPCI